MSYAEVNGISLYYEEHGSGQPLVLLHGGGLRDANWDGSARSVARLAILPGHTHYDIFSSPDLASAVIPFLDAASLEPPAPFGQ